MYIFMHYDVWTLINEFELDNSFPSVLAFRVGFMNNAPECIFIIISKLIISKLFISKLIICNTNRNFKFFC